MPDSWREWVLHKHHEGDNHRNLEAERKRLQDRLKRLARAYIDAGMSDAEYERERRRLQEKLAHLANPEIKTVLDAGQLLKTLTPAWEKATAEEKRDMLRIILDAVYVDVEEGTVTGLVPKPPFRLFFGGAGKEKDLARLCKVGEHLYFGTATRTEA